MDKEDGVSRCRLLRELDGPAGGTLHVVMGDLGQAEGSWWPDWTGWLGERSGEERDAPREPGSDDYPVLGEAPGTYVRQ